MGKLIGTAVIVAAVLAVFLLVERTQGRPSGTISRRKRLSDQRLAELETLLSLARMKGKLVTVPIGFGRVDPVKIGRKRRSNTESRLQNLRRLLKSTVQDESNSSVNDPRFLRLYTSSDMYGNEATDDRGDAVYY